MLFEPPDNNKDNNNSRSNRKPKNFTPSPAIGNLSLERQLQIKILINSIGSLVIEKPTSFTNDKEVVEYSGYVRLEEAEVIDYQNSIKEIFTNLMLQNFELRDAYLTELKKGLIN